MECSEDVMTPPMSIIMEELRDIKAREKEREKENKELRDQVERLLEQNNKNRQEINALHKENQDLRSTLAKGVDYDENMVKIEVKDQLQKEVHSWKEEREKQEIDIREIMKQQRTEQNEHMERNVVRIIKEKENIIRNTVQKKMCVIVFGDKEKDIPIKAIRQGEELKRAKEILSAVVEEGQEIGEQIEEIYRLGKYLRNGARPLKIRFSTQTAASTVLARTGKLSKTENMKHIWIRRDMTEEERNSLKNLREEAKTKNEERTQDQAKSFVWRVVDQKLKKWWLKDTRAEELQ